MSRRLFCLAPMLALGMPLARLSAGRQREIWLAAALVVKTAAVLIDEPVNALAVDSLARTPARRAVPPTWLAAWC